MANSFGFLRNSVSILAKIGLQSVDSTVATAVRAIVMTLFTVIFAISTGKGPQLTQSGSKHVGFIIL